MSVVPFRAVDLFRSVLTTMLICSMLVLPGCRNRDAEVSNAMSEQGEELPPALHGPARNLTEMVQKGFTEVGYKLIDRNGDTVSPEKFDEQPDGEFYMLTPKLRNVPMFAMRFKPEADELNGRPIVRVNVQALKLDLSNKTIKPDTSDDGEITSNQFVIDPGASSSENSVVSQQNEFERVMQVVATAVQRTLAQQSDAIEDGPRAGAKYAENESNIRTVRNWVIALGLGGAVLFMARTVIATFIGNAAWALFSNGSRLAFKVFIKLPYRIVMMFGPKGRIIATAAILGGLVLVVKYLKDKYLDDQTVEDMKLIAQDAKEIFNVPSGSAPHTGK